MKLRPPELRSALIERPGLERQLDQVLQAKLTIVSAAAGFGKTTVLSQWVRGLEARGVRILPGCSAI